jgi:hypothetical protein
MKAKAGPDLGYMKISGEYPTPWLLHVLHLGFVWRLLLGRPLDNQIRTNATFWHPATAGYPSRWLRMAGWKRGLIRLAVLYVLLLAAVVTAQTLLGHSPAPVLLAHAVPSAAVLGPLLVARLVRDYGFKIIYPALTWWRPRRGLPRLRLDAWLTYERQGRKTWERKYVRPLASSLAGVLSTTYQPTMARRWVTIPRDYREVTGSPVVIKLPSTFTGADEGVKKRLVGTVSARLGLRDPEVSWQLEGDAPRVLVSAPPVPPRLVEWADVERYYLASEEYRPFLGISGRGEALHAEMVSDSPHIALSAASGAGKSEMVKTIIMQALRWGWGVVILDWKEVSHEWAEGLDGVRIVRDIDAIHDMLVRLAEDLDIRKRSYREDRDLPGRAKVLVVYEEMNATSQLLTAYWADLRSTEPDPEVRRSMPLRSPAVTAQGSLVFGGRQFGMHMLAMAQKFSNRVTQGNTDIRENFAIKLLARYSMSTVKMLAPDIKPFPRKPANLGGWVAVMGNDAVVFQAPLITDEQAREYASGGQANPSHPLTSSYQPHLTYQAGRDSELGDRFGHDPAPALAGSLALVGELLPAADVRKLSECVPDLSHLGITLDVLRNEVKRDPDFPKSYGGSANRGFTYDFGAVQEWARRRHARQRAERAA